MTAHYFFYVGLRHHLKRVFFATSVMAHSRPSPGCPELIGLQHLVDAATALTQLVSSVPSAQKQGRSHTINDDEELRRARLASQAATMTPLPLGVAINNVPIAPNGAVPLQISPRDKKSLQHCPRQIFPERLMCILSDQSIADIITWLPHGRSFVINQPEVLADSILPKYFPESAGSSKISSSAACKYPSFTRKLNRWGFRQVTRGPDAGAFHHKFFRRDEPRHCLQMICQRSRRRKGDDKMDVINILPRNVSPSSINTLTAVTDGTDSESISSGSAKVAAPLKSSVFSQIGAAYNHMKTPTGTIDNSVVVSSTDSPTPLAIIAASGTFALTQSHQRPVSQIMNRHITQDTLVMHSSAETNATTQQSNNGHMPGYASFQRPFSMPTLKQLTPLLPIAPPVFDNVNQKLNPNSHQMEGSASVSVQSEARSNSSHVSAPPPAKTAGDSNGQLEVVSEEDARIANAKTMLYKAYLKALG